MSDGRNEEKRTLLVSHEGRPVGGVNPCRDVVQDLTLVWPVLPDGTPRDLGQVVRVLYTNWQGETRWRRIIPLPQAPAFRSTEWHPEPQWLLPVWDLDKGAERSYALKDVKAWLPGDGPVSATFPQEVAPPASPPVAPVS